MTLEEYKLALSKHDWLYDFSDDHNVWLKGQKQYNALVLAQGTLDPDRVIWNQYKLKVI